MTTHTPAPWAAIEIHTDPNHSFSIDAGVHLGSLVNWPIRADEMRANAHLIAAAPELLAALESVLEFMPIVANSPFGRANNVAAYIDDARAAIAKARGKA